MRWTVQPLESIAAKLSASADRTDGGAAATSGARQSSVAWLYQVVWAMAQAAFCVAGCVLILMDVHVGGVLSGTSNGKFVSFMDSVNSLADYRKQLPFDPPPPGDAVQCCTTEQPAGSRKSRYSLTDGHSIGMRLYILLAAFGSKYGSSTVASLLLNQTPVIMKGLRHVLSFLVRSSHAEPAPRSCPWLTADGTSRWHLDWFKESTRSIRQPPSLDRASLSWLLGQPCTRSAS